MVGTANHSIKQVMLVKERFERCGEEEPLVLDVGTKEEHVDKVSNWCDDRRTD